MIHVTHSIPVNEPGEPTLDRSAVWDGLVLKANNALPFVPAISMCEIIDQLNESTFDREIELFGDRYTERITLEAPRRVVFTRLSGPVLGTIVNDIEDVDDSIHLRFSFALVVAGTQSGSPEETDYADRTTDQYVAAVGATLGAMRKVARDLSTS